MVRVTYGNSNLAILPFSWLIEKAESHLSEDGTVVCTEPETAVLLGLRKSLNPFTPVTDLVEDADFVLRRSKKQWWMQMRPMMKILARHDSTYPTEKKSLATVHEHHNEHHAEHHNEFE